MRIINNSESSLVIQGNTVTSGNYLDIDKTQEQVYSFDPVLWGAIRTPGISLSDGVSEYAGEEAKEYLLRILAIPEASIYCGSHLLPVQIYPSTLTTGTVYWAMRNGDSGARIFINKIFIDADFIGTSAASRSILEFARFSTATPSGGTSLSVVSLDSQFPSSNLADARKSDSGLTTSGLSIESTPILSISVVSQVTANSFKSVVSENHLEIDSICLNAGEGFLIRAQGSIVSGVGLTGYLQWSEKPV